METASLIRAFPELSRVAARGVHVVSVDYRKALHGVHCPGPSDDVLTAWQLVFSSELIDEISLNYVGARERLDDPHAFAGNGRLTGHPPTLILNSDRDSDRDSIRASGELYGRQLQRAGIETAVEFEPGTSHGHLDRPHSGGARRSIGRVVRWIAASGGGATASPLLVSPPTTGGRRPPPPR